jgi:hypothetical protein
MRSTATVVATLSLFGAAHAGLYLKSSPVLQVDGKSYEKMIAKSNYTSVSLSLSLVVLRRSFPNWPFVIGPESLSH